MLSAWAVQPAGNGSVLDAVGQQHQQCPAACPNGANPFRCNATVSGSLPGRLAKGTAGEWTESWETWEQEHGTERFAVQHGSPTHKSLMENGGAAHENLLLNPDFVALLVRSAFILLEFGSRPLKNAKKMLSCGLICYWLYQYRYSGSGDPVLAHRYPPPHMACKYPPPHSLSLSLSTDILAPVTLSWVTCLEVGEWKRGGEGEEGGIMK
jgi:hypothetical protein